jgi:cell division protein ZapA
MKQLTVQIMGQNFVLSCPEGAEEQLETAVQTVDTAMCKIRDAGKVRSRDRIAVLAALNLAFDLADRQTNAAAQPPAPANTASTSPSEPSTGPESASLNKLLQRLDHALGKDEPQR